MNICDQVYTTIIRLGRYLFCLTHYKGGHYMKWFDNTALTLVIIGAVNWLLVGIFRFDLVAFLFGNLTWLSRIIYALVGLCGLYLISLFGRIQSMDS